MQGSIDRMLRNPLYIGKVRHRGEVYDGQHEPLIPLEVWERVERLRDARRSRPGGGRGRPPEGPFLFVGGMLRCGSCGGAMKPRSHGNDSYHCLTRIENGAAGCSQMPIRRALVDGAALDYFERVGLDVEATFEQLQSSMAREQADTRTLREQAERDQLQKLDALRRADDDYAEGRISGETYERFAVRHRGELEALEAQIVRLAAQEYEAAEAALVGDAEAALVEQMTRIRRAIVGDVRDAEGVEGVEAVRAALATLFDHFTYEPVHNPEGAVLYPTVRAEAVAGYIDTFPVPRKIPLVRRANNHTAAVAVV
jgi:hypothetical protein